VLRRYWRLHGPRLMADQTRRTMLHYTEHIPVFFVCVYVCVKCPFFNACAKVRERERERNHVTCVDEKGVGGGSWQVS
jgi:hypothetical protein